MSAPTRSAGRTIDVSLAISPVYNDDGVVIGTAAIARDIAAQKQAEADMHAAIQELEAFTYSVTDSGNVRTGAPSGQNDDAVISLALSAWSRETAPDFNVYEV